ncbi:hypothetical protein P7K49_003289 [Saguinus oedipus]|uniref:Uncharacterized protein n=1 Tax=Saguinus oedipus TaxID=9490 RepID=A0ABQ9WJS2_SAGOE|nr:hypothetical protein P7K49_003289 [Saguinus oedipus]
MAGLQPPRAASPNPVLAWKTGSHPAGPGDQGCGQKGPSNAQARPGVVQASRVPLLPGPGLGPSTCSLHVGTWAAESPLVEVGGRAVSTPGDSLCPNLRLQRQAPRAPAAGCSHSGNVSLGVELCQHRAPDPTLLWGVRT